MSSTYALGPHFEAFIQAQLATGRYADASDVLRDALRLMEERDRQYLALDKAIRQGIADVEAGRFFDVDEVCDELNARYAAMERDRQTT